MRSACLLAVLTGLTPAIVLGSDRDDFLAARSRHKLVSVSTPQILKEMPSGEAYIELNGKVYGSIKGAEGAVSLLVKFGDLSYVIESKTRPEWVQINESDVRFVLRATKTELQLTPTLELIASVAEQDALMIDEELILEIERKAEAARKKAEADRIANEQKASRGGTRSVFAGNVENPIIGDIGSARPNLSSAYAAIVPDYMSMILANNKNLPLNQAQFIAECVIAYSSQYGVDARLVMALIQHESNFNPLSTSSKGAMGLGQLMPDTAKGLGITDAYDIEQNVYGTVRTLRGHLERQSKESKDVTDLLVRALSAYNAGPGAVAKYDGMPPYAETQAYVQRVIKTYLKLSGKA